MRRYLMGRVVEVKEEACIEGKGRCYPDSGETDL
jgi:hypothetical protein